MKNHQTVKNSIFKFVLGTCSLMLFMNCSKDSGVSCLNGSWIQGVSSELQAWTVAANAYGEDPTVENCTNYKSGINAYINALDNVKKCVPGTSLSDFNGSLEEARQELSEIDCTGN